MPFLATLSIKDYIIAGLGALLLLCTLNTYLDVHLFGIGFEGWAPKAGRMERERNEANAKLAVSNASIATLQKALSDYVGAGKAAKVSQLAAVEAQAKDNAALQAQADAIRAEVAKLPAGKCETPASVKGAKGL